MKYIIPVTLIHIVGSPTFFSKGDNPNLKYDNSRHILPVCNKTMSGYDKHRMIILATYSQCQTGLINTGLKLSVVYQPVVESQAGLTNTGLI